MTLEFLLDDEPLLPTLDQVPLDATPPCLNDREDIFASAQTARLVNELDEKDIFIDEDDEARAQEIFTNGRSPSKYERTLPGVMLKLEALLTEYDHQIIRDADQVRVYVTNRLLEETNDPDPKIRLRAYELLGKISEVGLFTERQEVTVRHQSTEELQEILRSKIGRLIEGEATIVPAQPAEPQELLPSDVSIEDILASI
jgi:hypothetical protein